MTGGLDVLPSSPRAGRLATIRALGSMVDNAARARFLGGQALMRPLFVSWEINSACNLRCPYCYIHDRTYGFGDKGLAFADMRRVLGRIRRVTQDVMLLGGEPFLHPAWDDIVDYCNDALGLRVRCITNGTLLESHVRTTGRLHLLVVSQDHTRARVYPKVIADMKRQLADVASRYPRLAILINFVLCAEDDPGWVIA
ncbi:MAG: radical SAM protein, partial [Phycisphaerae bacterium]